MSCGFRVENTDPADLRPGKGGSCGDTAPESIPKFFCNLLQGLQLAKPTWKPEDMEPGYRSPQTSSTGRCVEG